MRKWIKSFMAAVLTIGAVALIVSLPLINVWIFVAFISAAIIAGITMVFRYDVFNKQEDEYGD